MKIFYFQEQRTVIFLYLALNAHSSWLCKILQVSGFIKTQPCIIHCSCIRTRFRVFQQSDRSWVNVATTAQMIQNQFYIGEGTTSKNRKIHEHYV